MDVDAFDAPPLPLVPIGVDSETGLILPGNLAPALVCVSTAERAGPDFRTDLHLREAGIAFYHRVLEDASRLLVIHNAPFDLAVACNEDVALVPKVFDAFEAGRVCCTVTLQKLIDVALGMRKFRRYGEPLRVVKSTYYLADLILLYCDEVVAKEDTWRKSYALLRDVPLSAWPESARRYAVYDAVLHLRLWEKQQEVVAHTFGGDLPDQVSQQKAAWALHLMGMWGIRADAAAVDRFIGHCQNEMAKMARAVRAHAAVDCDDGECDHGDSGIIKADGSRTMKEIRRRIVASLERRGIAVPMTPPSNTFPDGQVKADEETLRLTDDRKLHLLADSLTYQKHLGQWGPVLRAAVKRPVCCRYNVLVDNGRTSCSGGEGQEGTNIQNPPRKGDVRPCIVSQLGVLCSTDADTIELRANAQNCLELVGRSRMAEVIRRQFHDGGPDLHVVLAAGGLQISEDEAHRLHLADDVFFANARQLYKHVNFALAGGAGEETFALMARGFGLRLANTWEGEVLRARELKNVWLMTWPEMRDYFRLIGRLVGKGGRGVIRQLMSGRIRGDVSFTAAANSFFSGRVADAMKEILWHLANECYTGRCTSKHAHGGSGLCTHEGRSVLGGSRPIMFLHDEPILDHPEDGSESERAERQRVVVVDTLNRWMPDVPCTSSAVLSRRWYKGAKGVVVNGKLVPSRPEKFVGADGREKVKWVHDVGEVKAPVADTYEIESYDVPELETA